MTTLRLILGDQLNPDHSWYRQVDEDVVFAFGGHRPVLR